MDEYFEAKATLFTPSRTDLAVVNRADPWGRRLLERLACTGLPTETFAPEDATDVELLPEPKSASPGPVSAHSHSRRPATST